MGRRASAMALAAPGSPGTIVAMGADPGNPVAPAPWFVRVEPVVMLCAAPFFHEEWALPAGLPVTWRWRVAIGDDVDPAVALAAAIMAAA